MIPISFFDKDGNYLRSDLVDVCYTEDGTWQFDAPDLNGDEVKFGINGEIYDVPEQRDAIAILNGLTTESGPGNTLTTDMLREFINENQPFLE